MTHPLITDDMVNDAILAAILADGGTVEDYVSGREAAPEDYAELSLLIRGALNSAFSALPQLALHDELVAALEGVMDILGRAESNASGNPEFDYVGPRVAAARAALAKAKGGAA